MVHLRHRAVVLALATLAALAAATGVPALANAQPVEPHIMGGVCDIVGLWHAEFAGLGRSRWRIAPDGTARQLVRGGAVGKGRQDGPYVTIKWRSPNGDAWTLDADLDPSCQRAEAAMQRTRKAPRSGQETWQGRLCRRESCR